MNSRSALGRVNLVVALPCEARPLTRYFRMKQRGTLGGMRIYANDEGASLIVSGVGKLAAASACSLLAGLQAQADDSKAAWLNVGVAGHSRRPVGHGMLIHKVTDRASGRSDYPPLILDVECATSELITVEAPETAYREDSAYDMEGSAFLTTANRFMTSELVQLFKIVSDNPAESVRNVTEQAVSKWVEEQLDLIDRLVNNLADLSAELNQRQVLPEEYYRLAALTRLTASQRLQLESGYRRFYALGGSNLSEKIQAASIRSGAQLLKQLDSLIPPQ